MTKEEIKEVAQKMENGELNLVEWLDKHINEEFSKLGFRPMTDEEWEAFKAKRQHGKVTGTITFLKGDSAKRAAAMLKNKKN